MSCNWFPTKVHCFHECLLTQFRLFALNISVCTNTEHQGNRYPAARNSASPPRNLYAAAQYARNRYDSPGWESRHIDCFHSIWGNEDGRFDDVQSLQSLKMKSRQYDCLDRHWRRSSSPVTTRTIILTTFPFLWWWHWISSNGLALKKRQAIAWTNPLIHICVIKPYWVKDDGCEH